MSELHIISVIGADAHKARSLARRASTSDSTLASQQLGAGPEDDDRTSASSSASFPGPLTVSASSSLSRSDPQLGPGVFLDLLPGCEQPNALALAADGWPSDSLRASLAGGAFVATELAFTFCRERDLCKGALLFSVWKNTSQAVSTTVSMRAEWGGGGGGSAWLTRSMNDRQGG